MSLKLLRIKTSKNDLKWTKKIREPFFFGEISSRKFLRAASPDDMIHSVQHTMYYVGDYLQLEVRLFSR